QAAVDKALAASGVTLRYGGPATLARQDGERAEINQDDASWQSRLVVQAEGSFAFDESVSSRRDYGHHAVLATVRAERPVPDQAWERCTREGPLALLPIHIDSSSSRDDAYSVIWCCSPARAEYLSRLTEGEFAQQLE